MIGTSSATRRHITWKILDKSLADRWLEGQRILQDLIIPGSMQLEGDPYMMTLVTGLGPEDLARLLFSIAKVEYPLLRKPDWIESLQKLSQLLDAVNRGIQAENR